MYPKIRTLLSHCIEEGIASGVMDAYKHTDEPTKGYIQTCVDRHIWLFIDEYFEFNERTE